MHALTIRQPHAELIVCERKTIEVRTWWPRVQLPILVAIHAGKTADWSSLAGLFAMARFDPQIEVTDRADEYLRQRLGGIVGVAMLVERIEFCGYLGEIEGRARWERLADQHLNRLDSWSKNKVGFRFEGPIRFPEIIPCRGRQGLWELPEDVEGLVAAAIADHATPGAAHAMPAHPVRQPKRD